jgi:catechol 2,3-dioxygenase-like lactoylglutathione lyase family enzyme
VSGRINHVSINARNLQASVDSYVDLLRAQPISTPNFGLPVQWLALGRTQLHLFERDLQPTSHHHFRVTVDDLEPVYRAGERRGAFDYDAFRNHLVELPGDVVQHRGADARATLRAGLISAARAPHSGDPVRRRAAPERGAARGVPYETRYVRRNVWNPLPDTLTPPADTTAAEAKAAEASAQRSSRGPDQKASPTVTVRAVSAWWRSECGSPSS